MLKPAGEGRKALWAVADAADNAWRKALCNGRRRQGPAAVLVLQGEALDRAGLANEAYLAGEPDLPRIPGYEVEGVLATRSLLAGKK
jgi:hypothetical protein